MIPLVQRRAQQMRLITFILALFLVGPPAADEGKEYPYPAYSFTVHFPGEPTFEITPYQAPNDRSLEARVYSATQDTGVFKVTVVELSDDETAENVLVGHAVNAATEGGSGKFDIAHRIRAVYGRALGVAGGDGSYSYVAVFSHKKRLYQLEGKAFVGGGQAEVEAMRFH